MRVLVFAVLLAAVAAVAQEPVPAPVAEPADAMVNEEATAYAAAQEKVKKLLADGDKAKFYQMTMRVDADGKEVVCGRVDRPDKEGYYSNQRYFVLRDTPRLLHKENWQIDWKKNCGAIPADVREITEEEALYRKLQRMPIAPQLQVEE